MQGYANLNVGRPSAFALHGGERKMGGFPAYEGGMRAGLEMMRGRESMPTMAPQMQILVLAQLLRSLQAQMAPQAGAGGTPQSCYGPFLPNGGAAPRGGSDPDSGLPSVYQGLPGMDQPLHTPHHGGPHHAGPATQNWSQPQWNGAPPAWNRPSHPSAPHHSASHPSAPQETKWQKELKSDPKAQAAYDKLNPQQKSQLDKLTTQFGHQPGVAKNLTQLMESGRLQNSDKGGKTTLDHLSEFSQQKTAPGLDKAQGFKELVSNLAEPGNINQRNRGTCAITDVEFLHAQDHPSDYARVMTGLFSEKGEVKMANGETMTRNESGRVADQSGRTSTDRVYQSSISGCIDAKEGLHYDNNHLVANGTDVKVAGTAQATIDGAHLKKDGTVDHIGTGVEEISHAMKLVTGEDYHWTPISKGAGAIHQWFTERDLQKDMDKGQKPILCMTWDPNPGARDREHAVVMEKMDKDFVYLRNPWGNDETGGTNGPPREVLNQKTGEIRMKKSDFYARLDGKVNQGK